MTKARRTANLLPGGIPKWIRCYDNTGEPNETIDCFTVVFTGRYTQKTGGEHWVLAMNAAPYHPQGFGQHCSYRKVIDALGGKWPPAIGRKNHLGKRIHFQDLPKDCQHLVMTDYCELWDINQG